MRKEEEMVNPTRVVKRLLILATLTLGLLFFATNREPALAVSTCTTCDSTYGICDSDCYSSYFYCTIDNPESYCYGLLQTCREGCFNTYANCIGTCTYDGGGGGISTCGRGRTPCELACVDARHQCVADGFTDCGEQYQSCTTACCS